MAGLRFLVVLLVMIAAPASAATIHGLVYDDANGDGHPNVGERGVPHAIVAFGVAKFVETDARGQFEIRVHDDAKGIVWVRVPDGYRPGPVWGNWTGTETIDLGLHKLATPQRGPLTFVVAADTHLASTQQYFTGAELASVAAEATSLDPTPAFFTVLGDITQGNQDIEFDLVDGALRGLDAPWVPVPGNHDWYDSGATWFRRYGPDNYSFDIGDVHFVVWNMAMRDDEIRMYLGAELAHVAPAMTIVALTHAPPSPLVVDVLRSLGVDYVLTGHAHSNRSVDHDGVIELNTEPLMMGGLDFTPAGYRVVTIDNGKLTSYHRTVVEAPYLSIVAPARGQCIDDISTLLVAAELDAGTSNLTARIDCGTPIALRWAGGWTWRGELPKLPAGPHAITVEAASPTGARAETTTTFEACTPEPAHVVGASWPQLGGGAAHLGASTYEIAPPLVTRWTTAVGGHVLHASPIISDGIVYVATTDLADGDAGGIVALDLVTGVQRWRTATTKPLRGGVAVVGDLVVAAQIDGVVLGLDAQTGAVRWRYELSVGLPPAAGALFAAPSVDAGDILVGHQRTVAALAVTGTPLWTTEPVPEGLDSQSASAIAIAEGIAVGTFNRALGGVIAWDRTTGHELWRREDQETIAINASPVIAHDTVYVVTGVDQVLALDATNGDVRWRAQLDPTGFDWGNAVIGTPALSDGVLVVPTLYRDLVALDAATGIELWRHAGTPSPLRTTHYRGAREPGFSASPVVTGGIVWAVDTAGVLSALELRTGARLWSTTLGVPVLAGLAVSGDWLVAASYDGTVRALVPTAKQRAAALAPNCTDPLAAGGCCDAGGSPNAVMIVFVALALRRRRA